MRQTVAAVTILVPGYEEGLAFFRDVLDFHVLEDPRSDPANAGWSLPLR